MYQIDGGWGNGGAMHTSDGGATWAKNNTLPLAANLRGVTLDPSHPDRLFYSFFGGGILYGPRP